MIDSEHKLWNLFLGTWETRTVLPLTSAHCSWNFNQIITGILMFDAE